MPTKLKIGEPCPKENCGFPLHGITGTALTDAIKEIKSSLKSPSLPLVIKRGKTPSATKLYLICPRCDAYALGAEFKLGSEIISKGGRRTNVQELFDSGYLWGN